MVSDNQTNYNIMNGALVSVIITTHNRDSQIVLRAINSVLNQTYKNIEIIVVDDSTYNFSQRITVEQAVREADNRIIYIKHSTSKGACAARNTGLKHANGYYVAFLDDDDEWFPTKIENQIRGFVDQKIALVYCVIMVCDDVKHRRYNSNTNCPNGYIFNTLIKGNIIGSASNPLLKKESIIEVGGFDVLMQSAQDYDLWLRMSMKYPVHFINAPLLTYHIHSGECISNDIGKRISGLERINLKYAEHINSNIETWYRRHIVLLPYYLRQYGRARALSLWFTCVKKYPRGTAENLKAIVQIILGYDLYSKISELILDHSHKGNDCINICAYEGK